MLDFTIQRRDRENALIYVWGGFLEGCWGGKLDLFGDEGNYLETEFFNGGLGRECGLMFRRHFWIGDDAKNSVS